MPSYKAPLRDMRFLLNEVADPARLRALRETALLDSPAEEAFDRLARLTAKLLHAPVALISLVDADRQFFLSAQGLPDSLADLREMPVTHTFCRAVVETGRPLVVAYAREDARVRGHPAMRRISASSGSASKAERSAPASASCETASAPYDSAARRSTERQRAWAYCT